MNRFPWIPLIGLWIFCNVFFQNMAANFLHTTDLGSDTDDDDYVPEGEEKYGQLSEEEQSGDNEEDDLHDNNKKKKKKQTTKNPQRNGVFSMMEDDPEEKKREEERKKDFEKEKVELKEEEEKKKVDDLWAGKTLYFSDTPMLEFKRDIDQLLLVVRGLVLVGGVLFHSLQRSPVPVPIPLLFHFLGFFIFFDTS